MAGPLARLSWLAGLAGLAAAHGLEPEERCRRANDLARLSAGLSGHIGRPVASQFLASASPGVRWPG